MQTRTSFAIILPKMTCFLRLGLSHLYYRVNVNAQEEAAENSKWRTQVGRKSAQNRLIQFERVRIVIARTTGAAIRGILVALLVLTPALYLPVSSTNGTEIVVFLAILAFSLLFR